MKTKFFFVLIALLLMKQGFAAKRYWVGNGSNLNWNTTANWSATSGGSSGASVPGSSDTAYFNGSGTGKCKLDVSVNIKRMEVISGYTDTIFQNKNTITIGTSGFVQTGGTFYGDSTDITINGSFSMTAGKFRSTQSTLTCAGDFTASVNAGTFLHNNGKIKFTSSGTIFGPGSIHMYDVELNTSSSIAVTIYGNVAAYADHDLSYTGSGAITLTWGSFHVYGDLYLNSVTSGGGGTGSIFLEGTGNQTVHGGTAGFNSGRTPNLYFTKAAGTLSLTDNICVVSTTFSCTTTVTAGSSTMNFYGVKVISGSVSLNNVVFTGLPSYTNVLFNSSTDTITVNGDLYLEGPQGVAFGAGNISVKGDLYCNNTNVFGGGDAYINIIGTGSQTIHGTSTEGASTLSRIKINKSSGTLSLTGIISIDREWTYTAGTVSSGTSTVAFVHTNRLAGPTINGKQTLNNVTFTPTSTSSTVTVSDSLTVANLTFKGGTFPITVNTGVISVTGNITNNNTSGGGGGSGQLNITGTGSQTLTTTSTGTAVPGAFCNVAINKTGGTLTLSNNINASKSWTYAATSTTLTPGSSTVMFTGTTYTIGGTHTLNNVSVAPSSTAAVTAAVSNALTVSGTLTYAGNAAITVNTGTVNATGNVTITNTVSTGGGSALLSINGSGSQTLTGTSSSSALPLCNLLINKSAGTLTVTGTSLSAGGSVTCTTGTTVVSSSNTLYLYGSASLNAPSITFNHVSVSSGTRTLGGNLNMAGNLSVPTSSVTLDASGGNYAITLQGNWSNTGHFKSGAGYVNFTGTNNQTITQPVSASDSIAKLNINKASGTLTLSSIAAISDSLKFTSGKLTSDTTNLLVLWPRAKASGMSNSNFVNGPVKKIGNSAFTFPTGKGSDYQPITITAPSANTDAYIGEYFNSGQAFGSATGDSIAGLSTCEYWNLNRAAGTSTVSVTLGWNSSSCSTDTTINMRVANWNGSQWNNLGGINPTGNHTTGTITSLPVVIASLPLGSYVHLVLARRCHISVAISSSVPSDTICSGDSLTLTANPGGITSYPITSYTWTNSNNGTTVSTQTLSVNATGNYTITASNSIGCNTMQSVTVTVISYPLITVNSATVFIGATATLTATGATSFTWTPSTALDATSGATVHSNPSSTTVYTVTGTTAGCPGSATATVTIVPDSVPTSFGTGCICTASFAPQNGKKYLISAWVRESGVSPTVTTFTNPAIYIDFADGASAWLATSGPFYATGNIIDGWQRIEGTFTIPGSALYILLRLQSNSGDALFDDIRVFPYDASMKSYVYDPVTMRLVAELDERNYATQYEYDEEGKLIRVKKETERGIMTIKEDRSSSVKR